MSFKNYLTRDFVVTTLNNLPALQTPVIDGVYRRSINHASPYICLSQLSTPINNIPLAERGSQSHSLGNAENLEMFEPKPVRPSLFISAREMLDFHAMTGVDKETFLSGKIDLLRQACRRTAEAMAALALNGEYQYPVETLGGVELTPIKMGQIHIVSTEKWTSSSKIGKIIEDLENMSSIVRSQGFGSEIAFLVAPDVRQFLYEMISKLPNASGLVHFDTSSQDLIFGGHRIKSLSTTYYDYTSNSVKTALEPGSIIAIDLGADHKMIYCATEDLQNQFGALPFVVSQYESPEINGLKLFGQSKPFPAPVIQAMCKSSVL
ncbi:MAG: major capsid protein [Spirochaetia bacterium]